MCYTFFVAIFLTPIFMKNIHVFYDLDRLGSPLGLEAWILTPEDEQIKDIMDKLFEPMDKTKIDSASTLAPEYAHNIDMHPDAIKALLRSIPNVQTFISKLNNWKADWKELDVSAWNTKYNDFQIAILIFKWASDLNQSPADFINQTFNVNITRDTRVMLNGYPVSIYEAVGHDYRKSLILQETNKKLTKVRK